MQESIDAQTGLDSCTIMVRAGGAWGVCGGRAAHCGERFKLRQRIGKRNRIGALACTIAVCVWGALAGCTMHRPPAACTKHTPHHHHHHPTTPPHHHHTHTHTSSPTLQLEGAQSRVSSYRAQLNSTTTLEQMCQDEVEATKSLLGALPPPVHRSKCFASGQPQETSRQ